MKKKIAFFQNDLDVGGIQKSAVNLMRNMDYDRFEMHLFLSKKQDFWNLDFPKELHIHYLNPTRRFYSFVPFDYALKHIHYDFPEDILFDLAVDFNSYQCSCAVGALTVPARKRVMFIHNDVEIKYKNEWKYRVLWHCFKGKFKHFDAFVAGTASIIEPFRRLSGVTDKPYSSIHNFIDVEAIRKKAEEPTEVTVDENCMNFVALGRLVHQKGYDIMLNYFGEASKTRDDLRLYIIGDGEDREALEKQCEELGLKEKVFFLGSRSNPYSIMQKMDAFISTSRYEGHPLNIMDAMVIGLPLYCTKNLEQYTDGLVGRGDMTVALTAARKEEKHPDDLAAYNKKIIDSYWELAGGDTPTE